MKVPTSIAVRAPLNIWRRPVRTAVVTPVARYGQAAEPTRAELELANALTGPARYQRLLDEGQETSTCEIASGEKV